jgi:hypothetical protein
MNDQWFPNPETRWMRWLRPTTPPTQVKPSGAASVPIWQVDVALHPVVVASGRTLSASETWNGKALVYLTDQRGRPTARETVAEVELVQRLRHAGLNAYWSGGAQRWEDFTLRSSQSRRNLILELDKALRPTHSLLSSGKGGWPDVFAWDAHGDLVCFEYKGPSPSRPHVQDTIYDHQVAWIEAALSHGILHPDRCAVVRWIACADDAVLLTRQAQSKEPKRAVKRQP